MVDRSADVLIGATLDGTFDTVLRQADRRASAFFDNMDRRGDGVDLAPSASDTRRAYDDAMGAAYREVDSAMDKAEDRVSEFADSTRDRLRDASGQFTVEAPDMGSAYRGALDGVNANIEATRAHREQLRGSLFDAAALGASLYGLMRPAVAFESAMADVGKVMGLEKGTADYDYMYDSILRLSQELPLTANGLAAIVESAGNMGLVGDDATAFAVDAAKMGIAFGQSAEWSGKAMAALRNSLQLNQEEVRTLGDMINHVSNQSAFEASALVDFMGSEGAKIGIGVGVDQSDVMAMGSALLEMNIGAGEASTALRNMFLTLSKGAQMEGTKANIMESIGLDPATIAAEMSKGGDAARAAIDEVMDALLAVDETERAGVMSGIFGSLGTGTMTTLLAARDRVSELQTITQDTEGAAGSMLAEYETRANTTEFALENLTSTLGTLAITIGSTVLPALNDVLKTITPIVGQVVEFADANPELTRTIIGIGAALIGMKIASIGGAYAFSFLKEGALTLWKAGVLTYGMLSGAAWGSIATKMAPIGNAIRAIGTAFRATSVMMLANPVGLVIAGVALAVGAAVILIRKYWEPITAFFQGTWDGMQGIFTEMSNVVSTAFEPFKEAFAPLAPLFDGVGTAIGGVVGWFQDLLNPVQLTDEEFAKVHQNGMAFGEMLKTVLVGALDLALAPVRLLATAMEGLQSAFTFVSDWLNSFGITAQGTKDLLIVSFNGMLDGAWQLLNGLGTIFSNMWSYIQPGLASVWNNIVQVFGLQGAIDMGRNFVSGIWQGMKQLFGEMVQWVADQINALTDFMPNWVKDAMGIETTQSIRSEEEIAQEVSVRMEDEMFTGFNERMARASLIRQAEEVHADDVTKVSLFGNEYTEASDAVEAAREAYVEEQLAYAKSMHEMSVASEKLAREQAIRDELLAENEAIREARRAELDTSIAGAVAEPVEVSTPMVLTDTATPVELPPLEVEAIVDPVPIIDAMALTRPMARPDAPMATVATPETVVSPAPVVIEAPSIAAETPEPVAVELTPSGDVQASVAAEYTRGATMIQQAIAQTVALENARAASLAAERPRTITTTVTAPITVHNHGKPDEGGAAVAAGVSQGANDILGAERDLYAD